MQVFSNSLHNRNIPNFNSFQIVQEMIHYLEEHLLEHITLEKIASHFFLSDSSLNTLFSTTTDLTITEYIRNRRLSLAGQELLLTKSRIIDLAYKYGYETPEAFTKAFTRFHGMSPSQVRKSDGVLRMYHPIRFKLSVDGGEATYRMVSNRQFSLLSCSKIMRTTFTRKDWKEQDQNFWSECIINKSIEQLKEITGGTQLYSVKTPINRSEFKYSIGIPFDTDDSNEISSPTQDCIPDGFELLTIPYTTWAVFPCEGKNVDCIYDTKQMIFDQILTSSVFQQQHSGDFYVYKQHHESPNMGEIWVPVKLRDDNKVTNKNKFQNNNKKSDKSQYTNKKSDIPSWNQINLADMKQIETWKLILMLAKELDNSNIPYHFDGKTMIFVHGLEIDLNKIGITFKWSDEIKIKNFFGLNAQTFDYDYKNYKFFDTMYHGFPVRCMFYGKSNEQISDETLQTNAEPIRVDGQIIMAQTLEFYLEYASEDDELYKRVENFVKNRLIE